MTSVQSTPIVLPALCGNMGNRAYYSCLMSFEEIADRVSYASDIHKNQSFSDMIQREIEERRIREIIQYLEEQPERFFNSIVVAIYGGDPNWYFLSNVKNKHTEEDLHLLTEETTESVGFLRLDGNENLFAVDGQHRLAGIKEAIKIDNGSDYCEDTVSVIFVAHETSPEGMQKTRRLFTTLNKEARRVSKGGIIALDEDDVIAICVRRLVEETRFFAGKRAAFVGENNLPVNNAVSLTTIGNLYDVLGILFSMAATDLRKPKRQLVRKRPF
jgi:DNA sulfur modification protein DndB